MAYEAQLMAEEVPAWKSLMEDTFSISDVDPRIRTASLFMRVMPINPTSRCDQRAGLPEDFLAPNEMPRLSFVPDMNYPAGVWALFRTHSKDAVF